jgi:hypothetical protein
LRPSRIRIDHRVRTIDVGNHVMAAYAPSGLFGMSGGWFLALKRQALCLCPFGTGGNTVGLRFLGGGPRAMAIAVRVTPRN